MISAAFRNQKGRAPASPRRSSLALTLAGIGVLLLGLMFLQAHLQRQADLPLLEHAAGLVKKLELTDLSLFTEARYTRHPSQTDIHSAFQDHPVALEHFPSGSIAGPPTAVRRHLGRLD